jgi:DNA gyrase subunit A
MGVVFARFDESDSIIGIAKNTERNLESAADGLAEDNEGAVDSEGAIETSNEGAE